VSCVCWQCIEDEYLKEIVKDEGKVAKCSLCDCRRKSFTAGDLAKAVDPIMREHFALGEDVKRFGPDDEKWWEQKGEQLDHHLQEVIGQYLGFEDEIVEALEISDPARPQDGDMPFYDNSQNYVPVSIESNAYAYFEDWNYVSEDLKHRRRFFSSAASSFFERIFEGVETRPSYNDETGAKESVVWEMPEGSMFFRARICHSEALIKEAYKEPLKHVGPPPADLAQTGRMSVEGVVAFYGALDRDTSLAETRPAIGNDIAVIQLRATRALRLLDFSRLGHSYNRLSYFQPDFADLVGKGAFLRRLENLISQPVIPGREMDYLITQTMAEYLAHVHRPAFDGVLFKSVQKSGGVNIVLFQNGSDGFPLAYVDKSFELFSTRSVQYKHAERCVGEHEGEVWVSRGGGYDDEA